MWIKRLFFHRTTYKAWFAKCFLSGLITIFTNVLYTVLQKNLAMDSVPTFLFAAGLPWGRRRRSSRTVLSTFLFLRTFWLATRGHEVVFSAASWWSSKMDEEAEKKEDSAFVSRVHLGLPKNEVRFEWLRQKISYLEGLNSFGISFPEMVSCSYHDIKTSQQYRVHISEISRCSSALLINIFGQKMPKKTKKNPKERRKSLHRFFSGTSKQILWAGLYCASHSHTPKQRL